MVVKFDPLNPHYCPGSSISGNEPCDGWVRNDVSGKVITNCKACVPSGDGKTRLYKHHRCTPECPYFKEEG